MQFQKIFLRRYRPAEWEGSVGTVAWARSCFNHARAFSHVARGMETELRADLVKHEREPLLLHLTPTHLFLD